MEYRPHRRNLSPGTRRLNTGGPMRSSTGNITSNYAPPPQYYSTYRSPVEYQSPQGSGDRIYDSRRSAQDSYVESPTSAKSRGQYYGSSRRATLDTGAQRPKILAPPAAPRPKSIIHNGYDDRPPSPLSRSRNYDDDNEPYTLQPASSRAPRGQNKRYSVDGYETNRLAPAGVDRDPGRGAYRGNKGYHTGGPMTRDPAARDDRTYRPRDPARYDPRVDGTDSYAYTEPHDLWNEPPPRRNRGESMDRADRPFAMGEFGRYLPRDPRDAPPPSNSRGFKDMPRSADMSRSGSLGHTPRTYGRDDPRPYYPPGPDGPLYDDPSRRPVSLHQKPLPYPTEPELFPAEPRINDRGRDDYSRFDNDPFHDRRGRDSSEERYDNREKRRSVGRPRERDDPERPPPRDRLDDEERRRLRDVDLEPIADRDEREERRRRRDREEELSRDKDRIAEDRPRDKDRVPDDRPRDKDRAPDDRPRKPREEEDRPRQPREEDIDAVMEQLQRDQERRRREANPETAAAAAAAAAEVGLRRDEPSRKERDEPSRKERDEPLREEEPQHHHHHHHHHSGEDSPDRDRDRGIPLDRLMPKEEKAEPLREKGKSDERGRDSVGGKDDIESNRKSVVRVVSPASMEAEEQRKPKGILRKPREKFPEEPADVREGVAPLKDGSKKGIPTNAKWTKISRKMVNPEALIEANERFEERLDHVIVLRVLPKEEIEGLAKRTQEIRGKIALCFYICRC